MKYLTTQNAKTVKGEDLGYATAILYLKPGGWRCPNAHNCLKVCLYTAGRGAFSNVRKARERKTEAFEDDPMAFVDQLVLDITEHSHNSVVAGLIPVVRLNGTSDIPWHRIPSSDGKILMDHFPGITFYDYTKVFTRLEDELPPNYHLTFSRDETTPTEFIRHTLRRKVNVSVVFDRRPDQWCGWPVINGDEHDLRFLDPEGVIVGLTAKGRAKQDKTGFVVHARA
jgi:hypothetical protein